MLDKKYLDNLIKRDGGIYKSESLLDSYRLCKEITDSHYENFPVASALAPKEKRKYVQAIYSFARIADDIADESEHSDSEKLRILDEMQEFLVNRSAPQNPVFLALYDTMDMANIPSLPLENLLLAFKMDSEFKQPDNWDDLLNYCSYSANPVGELVLRVFGEYSQENKKLSDAICSGLQLANFWQDFSRDLPNGRVYAPNELLLKYEINPNNIQNAKVESREMLLNSLIQYTENLFRIGEELPSKLKSKRLRVEIRLTLEGGKKILAKVKKAKNRIFVKRPEIKKIDLVAIFLKSFFFPEK